MTHSLLEKPFFKLSLKRDDGKTTTLDALLSETKAFLMAKPVTSEDERKMQNLVTQVFDWADDANRLFFALRDTLPKTPHKQVNAVLSKYNSLSVLTPAIIVYNCCVLTVGMLAAIQGDVKIVKMTRSLAIQLMEKAKDELESEKDTCVEQLLLLIHAYKLNMEDILPQETRTPLEDELRKAIDAIHDLQDVMSDILDKSE